MDNLPVFDEWRGGVGMSLAVARRIVNAHDGRVSGPPEGRKTGALIVLPRQPREASDPRAGTPHTPDPA